MGPSADSRFRVENISETPEIMGVYVMRDNEGRIVYIGKSRTIRSRLYQHLKSEAVTEKSRHMQRDVRVVDILPQKSEFESLIVEAELIRLHKPKYNAIARDDKSPVYIVITQSDELPFIRYARKRDIPEVPRRSRYGTDRVFGPFSTARTVRGLLRTIRRIVPFCSSPERTGKPCFYTELGDCLPCPSMIVGMENASDRHALVLEYRRNIRRIIRMLEGKSTRVLSEMETTMKQAANRLDFEAANEIKQRIIAYRTLLTHTFTPHLSDGLSQPPDVGITELHRLLIEYFPSLTSLERIECMDISTFQATNSVGSMVVFTDGIPDTGQYRKFRIRGPQRRGDAEMMGEVVRRRFGHPEWRFPDLLCIDGGKPQLRSVYAMLGQLGMAVPVVGLAKRFEEVYLQPPGSRDWTKLSLPAGNPGLQLLQRIRDESHRFAHSYHTNLRSKNTGLALTR